MNEEWKVITDYPNYMVSNLGRVRNKSGKILQPAKCGGVDGKTYYTVKLGRNGYTEHKNKRVHRLVAEAFIPNPHNKREINHIDGNHLNNVVSNLEWSTRSENMKHSFRVLHRKNGRERKVMRLEDGKVFNSITEATRSSGLKTITSIQQCLGGINKTAGGYHWKYADIGGNQ